MFYSSFNINLKYDFILYLFQQLLVRYQLMFRQQLENNESYSIFFSHSFFTGLQFVSSIQFVRSISYNSCKDIYYIGESERKVSTRIKEHIRDIKNFIAYTRYSSVVAEHFNLLGHNYKRDFKFCVIKSDLSDMRIRLDHENNFVHLFKKLGLKILNDPQRIKSVYSFGLQI